MQNHKNPRSSATKEKIYYALMTLLKTKKFNDIYVKDICAEAGINRSSFYEHYRDINDLMIKTEEKLSSGISEIFNKSENFDRRCFIAFFEFICEHRDFYYAYLTYNEYTAMGQADFVKYLNSAQNQSEKDDDVQFHMAFFSGGLQAICKAWILTGMKKTPEQMTDIIFEEYKEKAKYF